MEVAAISEITPGRILARAVTNSAGAVLCGAGCRLTQSLVERLANAGIETVYVEGEGKSGPSAEERLRALHERFQGITDPALLELKSIAEARLDAMQRQEEAR